MHNERERDVVDNFREIARVHQLKITPQRMAIFKKLVSLENHPTADSLYREVREEFPNISFDTVNRTLITFSEAGIIDVVEDHGNQKRYDPNTSTHHHLHCINCGNIIDFQDEKLDNIEIPQVIREQYRIISKRVVLKVLCTECTGQR